MLAMPLLKLLTKHNKAIRQLCNISFVLVAILSAVPDCTRKGLGLQVCSYIAKCSI